MNELVLKNPDTGAVDASVGSLIERFLAAHDVKPITREGYRRRLRGFFWWCAKANICQPSLETIISYKRYMQEQAWTALTIASYLTSIRCFFAWGESVKLYPNIARLVKSPRKQKGFRRDPLTLPQVLELFDSIERDTLKGKRDFALLNLLVRVGLRSVEVVRADVGDIRQESGEVVLWVMGKGAEAKDSFVCLTPEAYGPIQDYLAARGPVREDDPLFGSTSDGNRHARMTTRSIRRIAKERFRGIKLDSPRLSCHSTRHTCVTLSLKAGASLMETQALARHEDIRVTMNYAHVIERARGVPEKAIADLLATSKRRFPDGQVS